MDERKRGVLGGVLAPYGDVERPAAKTMPASAADGLEYGKRHLAAMQGESFFQEGFLVFFELFFRLGFARRDSM